MMFQLALLTPAAEATLVAWRGHIIRADAPFANFVGLSLSSAFREASRRGWTLTPRPASEPELQVAA